jgi:thiol-disulfide isomerase/thioredoxin
VTPGVIVLLVVVAAVAAYGGWWAASNGRFRGTHRIKGGRAASASELRRDHEPVETTWDAVIAAGSTRDASLGERATLVQFSTSFCAPCRAARRILTDVANLVPGVVHVEVDAEHHLELVRRLGVLRTPTTLVLGPDGHEVTRASGAPTKVQVLNALAQVS